MDTNDFEKVAQIKQQYKNKFNYDCEIVAPDDISDDDALTDDVPELLPDKKEDVSYRFADAAVYMNGQIVGYRSWRMDLEQNQIALQEVLLTSNEKNPKKLSPEGIILTLEEYTEFLNKIPAPDFALDCSYADIMKWKSKSPFSMSSYELPKPTAPDFDFSAYGEEYKFYFIK